MAHLSFQNFEPLIPLLAHPDSKKNLNMEEIKKYPSSYGIPWLYSQPQQEWTRWCSLSHGLIAQHTKNIIEVEKELKTKVCDHTLKRLKALLTGLQYNKDQLQNILAPLLSSQSHENMIHYSVAEALSPTQTLDSYFNNIFRDWVWGETENQIYLDLMKKNIQNEKGSTALVLGSGSGKLGWDLATHFNFKNIILLDINPLLLSISAWAFLKKNISLYEFPKNPIQQSNTSVLHSLNFSDINTSSNVFHVFADVSQPPFLEKSIDFIITPWLIDIVEEDFSTLSIRLNSLLKEQGQWINFGPLGFQKLEKSKNLVREEVEHYIHQAGFEITNDTELLSPYLQSPYSGQHRLEKLFVFLAKKKQHLAAPPPPSSLPKWLKDLSLPIPQFSKLIEVRLKNQIYSEILGAVDGKRSFTDLKNLMSLHYKMTNEQAKESLLTLLLRIYKSDF